MLVTKSEVVSQQLPLLSAPRIALKNDPGKADPTGFVSLLADMATILKFILMVVRD